ncbi:hypothetical protein PVT71_12435 [Salipiger sp. H15]|uniref:DUF2946 domain-containing protein n=1 Tax=Alloyangia sp. H15 TaxID=3029062 RepID=A0AAU8AEC2_9RHOB
MTRLALRLLLLTLLGVWTVLPLAPVHAMPAGHAAAGAQMAMDHGSHASSAQDQTGHQSLHEQICAVHCLPVDAPRPGLPGAEVMARMSRIETSLADVSLSSREYAPTSPPPRG